MYVKPNENRTHYSTEDIEAAVAAVMAAVKSKPKKWRWKSQVRVCFGLRYCKTVSSSLPLLAQKAPRYANTYRESDNILVLRKKDVDRWETQGRIV